MHCQASTGLQCPRYLTIFVCFHHVNSFAFTIFVCFTVWWLVLSPSSHCLLTTSVLVVVLPQCVLTLSLWTLYPRIVLSLCHCSHHIRVPSPGACVCHDIEGLRKATQQASTIGHRSQHSLAGSYIDSCTLSGPVTAVTIYQVCILTVAQRIGSLCCFTQPVNRNQPNASAALFHSQCLW